MWIKTSKIRSFYSKLIGTELRLKKREFFKCKDFRLNKLETLYQFSKKVNSVFLRLRQADK